MEYVNFKPLFEVRDQEHLGLSQKILSELDKSILTLPGKLEVKVGVEKGKTSVDGKIQVVTITPLYASFKRIIIPKKYQEQIIGDITLDPNVMSFKTEGHEFIIFYNPRIHPAP